MRAAMVRKALPVQPGIMVQLGQPAPLVQLVRRVMLVLQVPPERGLQEQQEHKVMQALPVLMVPRGQV